MPAVTTSEPMIEATPGELEALRLALGSVAHLERCEPILAAARVGRIPTDDFVLTSVRAARDRLAAAMLEHRRSWPPSAIAHTSRRRATLERLLAHLETARS
jgi:hypothetical protein